MTVLLRPYTERISSGQYLSLLSSSPSDQMALFLQVVQEVQGLPWDLDVQQVPHVPPSLEDSAYTQELIVNKMLSI